MTNKKNNLEKLRPKIVKILKEKGVKKAGVFGSFARGEQTDKSDIDILISFEGSLLGLISIERELEGRLGIKVDLLTYKGINPLLKKRILGEEIKII